MLDHLFKYINEHGDELVFLTIVGVIGIRADYLLMKIEETLRVFIPVKVKPPEKVTNIRLRMNVYSNPCVCTHDESVHYWRSRATHNQTGCYSCKTCTGFVTMQIFDHT